MIWLPRSSRRCSAKVPQLDPGEIEDLILGNGQPAGEAGFNIGRVVAILSGLDNVPGVTVNRYCSSSLQTIRMAAHAIKAGEGDVFVAAGVETVSRFFDGKLGRRPEYPQPALRRGRGPVREAFRRRPASVVAAAGTSRHLHRHGPDGRERRRVRERLAARRWTSTQPGLRTWRSSTWRTASSSARSSRSPFTTAPWCRRMTARAPTRLSKASRSSSRLPARWPDHRRERLPAQRRRGSGARHERPQGFPARAQPLARVVSLGRQRPQPRDHGSRPHRGESPGAEASGPDDGRHRPRRDQ